MLLPEPAVQGRLSGQQESDRLGFECQDHNGLLAGRGPSQSSAACMALRSNWGSLINCSKRQLVHRKEERRSAQGCRDAYLLNCCPIRTMRPQHCEKTGFEAVSPTMTML